MAFEILKYQSFIMIRYIFIVFILCKKVNFFHESLSCTNIVFSLEHNVAIFIKWNKVPILIYSLVLDLVQTSKHSNLRQQSVNALRQQKYPTRN